MRSTQRPFYNPSMIQTQSIDIMRALTHIREDADWLKKLAIGFVVSIVPFLNFAGLGYGNKVLKNASEGRDTPLPEWNDIADLFITGLKLLVPSLVYSLPMIVLACVMQVLLIGVSAAAESSNGDAASLAAGGLGFGVMCLVGLTFVYAFFIAYISPAIHIQFARTNGDIGATLKLGEILNITRANSGEYIKMILGVIGVSLLVGVLTMATCGLGAIVAAPLSFIVMPHLAGQYKRIAGL